MLLFLLFVIFSSAIATVPDVADFSDLNGDAKIVAKLKLDNEFIAAKEMSDVVDSSPFRFVHNFFKSQPYAKSISKSAVFALTALKMLRNRFGSSFMHLAGNAPILKSLEGQFYADAPMPDPPDIDYCPYPRQLLCQERLQQEWFRSIDGSCNNLGKPLIGRSMTPFRRLLSARYADGIEMFRMSVDGTPLPSARFISFNLFHDVSRPSLETTFLFVFFGQLTDHDLTRTAATLVPDLTAGPGEARMMEIKCGLDGCLRNVDGLEACAPIPVSVDDVDFAHFNRCLKFVRNMEVPNLDCDNGPREQLNQVTHWLDGSEVYGSTNDELKLLRDLTESGRGKMAVVAHPHKLKPLLPREVITNEPSMCTSNNATVHCFQAGDPRVNENIGLGTLHTLFVRYHNVIEEKLYVVNPHWTGDQLFHETRRIIVAILQHITYNEWLPLLLGPKIIHEYGLDLLPRGYFEKYNADVDGRVPNEFATAAFRLGHTLLEERITRLSPDLTRHDSLLLSETFNHPEHLFETHKGGVDGVVMGLSYQPSQTYDHFFTKQITRSLFADNPPNGLGHDLLSLNIQRGRDHGLGTYNEYRELCSLKRAESFDDLEQEIVEGRYRHLLSSIYRHVDDIDLFVGGVSEQPVPHGIAGPTFACIVANTFRNLRHADRLWYENKEAGFTPEQLQEIRKITMAKIICINGDHIKRIQPFAFLQPGKKPTFYQYESRTSNDPLDCDHIPDIDINHWRTHHAVTNF